ncbi:MAG: molybdopterin-dependent oxidoreductase [Dehalococcoidia bacterium]|nr:molybdopterin-dependent oxidoreductase [Dehalococcoidia bacterium]
MRRTGVVGGLAAAVVMLAVMLFIRIVLGIPSLPEMLADVFTRIIPLSIFSALLGALESNAKPLMLVGILLGHLIMGMLLGLVYARVWGRSSLRSSERLGLLGPWSGGLLLAALLWLMALLVVMPTGGAGLLGLAGRPGPVSLALSTLASSLAFGVALVTFFQGMLAVRSDTSGELPQADRDRRAFLLKLASVPMALLVGGALWQLLEKQIGADLQDMGSALQTSGTGILPEEITSNADFYTVSKNFEDPTVDLQKWSLDLKDQGGRRLTLSYGDLKSLPSVEQAATLMCISNEVGGDLISNAVWTGVRMRDLLAQLGATSADRVVLRAWDGYADSIPFDKAMQDGTILVYSMNGEALPDAHGYPARLVVPGIYGMKNVKWVRAIELVDGDFQGYWQERGWTNVATIKTVSRFDVPAKGATLPLAPVALGGIAFAGDRGVSKVEVSPDAGNTWLQMNVKEALSPYAWSLWTGQWQPTKPGDYVLLARAWDKLGQVQDRKDTGALPDGASGYDGLSLTLR